MTESNQKCRQMINLMILTGFFIHYMLLAIFSIAIVDMVKFNETVISDDSESIRFNWTQNQKHSLIGIFMWGQILSELPFGRLLNSLLTILLPFAFQVNYNFAWFYRFVMGLFNAHPRISIEIMAVRWFPPSERSKFMGKTLTGSIGEAFALLCAGYIISYSGWPSLFYICGFISLLWTLVWFYFIYDSPQEHPRINPAEKRDILCGLKNEMKYLGRPKKLPLKQIFTNRKVLALLLTFVFSGFSYATFVNYIPTFISNVLHFNIRENGILSSLHYIGNFIFGTLACYIANMLIKSKTFSTTTVRKLCTGIGQFGSALLILSLILWGNNRSYCIFVFIASFSVKSFILGGHVINSIDLAPNFAATLSSFCFIISLLSGWTATKVISATVSVDNTLDSWKLMFIILSISTTLAGLIFVLFSSGEIQPFNDTELKNNSKNVCLNPKEMEQLKVDSI